MSTSTPAAEYCGVLKTDVVRDYIHRETSGQQIELQTAIDGLSLNPRPDGHRLVRPPGLVQLLLTATRPQVYLLYDVDDERKRVDVLSIMRFQ